MSAVLEISPGLRVRIIRQDDCVDPTSLLANPRNFRRHPKEQLDEIQNQIETLGWVKRIIVNDRTGFVVDGHARVEVALRAGWECVPVDYIDVSADEEITILATLDEITGMAYKDEDALADLMADIDATHNDDMKRLVRFMAGPSLDEPEDSPSQLGDVKYQVIVDVRSETEQADLINRLEGEGLVCKALML